MINSKENFYDVAIIGGGLAGLSAAIHLRKYGYKVLLFEKNTYPKHKVCGEYISNEVLPYLDYLEVNVHALGAVKIDKFELSTVNNKIIRSNLPLGGFGISRYTLDNALFEKALEKGIYFINDTVVDIKFEKDIFSVSTKINGEFQAKIAIGAYGKRANLDLKLNRPFIQKKSPYLAVKTHVKGQFPNDIVTLHNFKGGYCGVSKVEDDRINLCYIVDFKVFKKYKDISEFQEQVVFQNDYLKEIFKESTPLFETPLTISQISFDRKSPVEKHMLMCGDAAGMIHPLCGNGMSMAIRSAQMASSLIIKFLSGEIKNRERMEQTYIKEWNIAFKSRLLVGHLVARLFNYSRFSEISHGILRKLPFLIPLIIKQTHGKPMQIK